MPRPFAVLTLMAFAAGTPALAEQAATAETAGDFPGAAPMTETDLDTARGSQGVYYASK